MNIVGINGFKRSGKGETAAALSRLHDGFVYEIGFADKLKMIAALALGHRGGPRDLIALMDEFKEMGVITHGMWDPSDARDHRARMLTGREYLQNLGNEARNTFGDTFWIDMVLPRPAVPGLNGPTNADRIERMYPDVDVVAITDLRYENEAARIKALGGVVWEVVRPGLESDGHASEQPLPRELVDWQIINDGDLSDLEDKVNEAIREAL
jgi:hypothetical protein